jgi:hypothetical protein
MLLKVSARTASQEGLYPGVERIALANLPWSHEESMRQGDRKPKYRHCDAASNSILQTPHVVRHTLEDLLAVACLVIWKRKIAKNVLFRTGSSYSVGVALEGAVKSQS